jgi:hypothetical protein
MSSDRTKQPAGPISGQDPVCRGWSPGASRLHPPRSVAPDGHQGMFTSSPGKWRGRSSVPWTGSDASDWAAGRPVIILRLDRCWFPLRDEMQDQRAGAIAVLVQRSVTADGSELARPSGDSELLVWRRSVDEGEGQRAATVDADDARAVRQASRLNENTTADLVADRRAALRQLVVEDDDVGCGGSWLPEVGLIERAERHRETHRPTAAVTRVRGRGRG